MNTVLGTAGRETPDQTEKLETKGGREKIKRPQHRKEQRTRPGCPGLPQKGIRDRAGQEEAVRALPPGRAGAAPASCGWGRGRAGPGWAGGQRGQRPRAPGRHGAAGGVGRQRLRKVGTGRRRSSGGAGGSALPEPGGAGRGPGA